MVKPPSFIYGLEMMSWIVDGMTEAGKQAEKDQQEILESYMKSNDRELPPEGWEERNRMHYALDWLTKYYTRAKE